MLRNDQVQQLVPNYPRAEHFDQARDELLGMKSLGLKRNEDTNALSMDPNVQEDKRKTMKDEEFTMSFEGVVELLASHWHRYKDAQGANDVLNHVMKLAIYYYFGGSGADPVPAIGVPSRKIFVYLLVLATT